MKQYQQVVLFINALQLLHIAMQNSVQYLMSVAGACAWLRELQCNISL